jgi:outer membrane protein, multidrug efflux system
MRGRPIPLLATLLLLSGCSLAPKYTRPPLPVASSWPEPATAEKFAPSAAEVPWQDFFADSRLRSVIELALANNRDLRVAALNVERAQALYRIHRSELYPGVGVMASGDRYRLPEAMSSNGQAEIVSQYTVAVGTVSWEIDFFGRIRSLKDSALHQYLATEQARSAVQMSLVAAVAGTYLSLAADGEALQLARDTLEAQAASLELIRKSSDVGIASHLDVRQAESQVEAARAAVARYTGLLATDRNALDLLTGAPVGAELLPGGWDDVKEIPELSPGLPSDVLLRRPDILAAEHQLQATNANIGAARAAFFPNITLTAGAGTMSADLSDLFGSGSGTWSFSPQILAPIFAGGSLKANLKVAEVNREIAVARYEEAIQQAFGEVSDALTLRKTLLAQREAQASLVHALQEAYRLSDARYRGGIDSYLGVLVAQRSLFVAQQALVGVRLAEQVNLVTLYKVLGGGA